MAFLKHLLGQGTCKWVMKTYTCFLREVNLELLKNCWHLKFFLQNHFARIAQTYVEVFLSNVGSNSLVNDPRGRVETY